MTISYVLDITKEEVEPAQYALCRSLEEPSEASMTENQRANAFSNCENEPSRAEKDTAALTNPKDSTYVKDSLLDGLGEE